VNLTNDVYTRLRHAGQFGDTFCDIIRKLLDTYELSNRGNAVGDSND
jgi:hypothetical protein